MRWYSSGDVPRYSVLLLRTLEPLSMLRNVRSVQIEDVPKEFHDHLARSIMGSEPLVDNLDIGGDLTSAVEGCKLCQRDLAVFKKSLAADNLTDYLVERTLLFLRVKYHLRWNPECQRRKCKLNDMRLRCSLAMDRSTQQPRRLARSTPKVAEACWWPLREISGRLVSTRRSRGRVGLERDSLPWDDRWRVEALCT